MKSSTSRVTLVALLTVGAFASSAAIAQPGPDHRSPPPPLSHQADHRQPPPPPHQADHRLPPPPPHQIDHRPPPSHHVDHRPPPRVVHIDRRDNWRKGRALPRNVKYYDVAPDRLRAYSLPPAPRGQRYVRVANDILLIAIGTGLVVDAIQDLAY